MGELSDIEADIHSKDPGDLTSHLKKVELELEKNIEILSSLKNRTDECLNKHQQRLKQRKGDIKKKEILNNLNHNKEKLQELQVGIKRLKSKQDNIADIIKQTRNLVSMGEEKMAADDMELKNIVNGTIHLKDSVNKIQDEVKTIESEIKSKDPVILLSHLTSVESDTWADIEVLGKLKQETDNCLEKHKEMLRQGIKQKEDEENARRQLQEDGDSLNKLKNDAQIISGKQKDLESELKKSCEDDEEEKRRLAELEKLLQQQKDLLEVEKSLEDTATKYEEWRDFQWTPEEESMFQKYGMVSSLSMPSFPLGLIKDPALLAAIQKRHSDLLELRKQLRLDSIRMQEICEALEEMERQQREAELRRISAQSREWIKDFIPSGPAEFGAEPSFKSDFHIDPEEARAAAASRKASRMQSRESS